MIKYHCMSCNVEYLCPWIISHCPICGKEYMFDGTKVELKIAIIPDEKENKELNKDETKNY